MVAVLGSASGLAPAREGLAQVVPVVVRREGVTSARRVVVVTSAHRVERVMSAGETAVVATTAARPREMLAPRDVSSVTSSPVRGSSARRPSGPLRTSVTRTKARAHMVTIATSTA